VSDKKSQRRYLRRVTPLKERYEKYTDTSAGEDGCHLWTGPKNNRGYGRISRGRRGEGRVFAHRLSWGIHFGPIPEGKVVCHHCDNPPCVNPKHLFIGTNSDNLKDAVRKGRHHNGRRPRGAEHHNAKLAVHIDEIRDRLAAGESQRSIAKRFGVVSNAIRNISIGKSYAL